MPTHTKGNVIVENIKVGDIHYEYNGYEEKNEKLVDKNGDIINMKQEVKVNWKEID
jgi:hypothetical protein